MINFSGTFSSALRMQQQQRQQQKENLIKENYNHIYTHEMAHKSAGGSLAGSITIEKNSEGIPISGHVPIKMPVLDKTNPNKTIENADIVIKSAMAPSDPSNQDYKVAAEAQTIKAQAQRLLHGNKLNYYA